MTDHASFLTAILAAPDDDAPRLIAADWLEGRGECDRAAFVRVQCQLATTPLCNACHETERLGRPAQSACCCSAAALRRRERQLLGKHFGAWTDGLPEPLVTKECPDCADGVADYETGVVECRRCECTGLVADDDKVEFRRGFVEHVSCTAADFIAHYDALVKTAPIREVTLTTMPETGIEYGHSAKDRGRLTGRLRWHYLEERPWDQASLAAHLLTIDYPSVKTWNLPPDEPPRIVGQPPRPLIRSPQSGPSRR